MKTYYKWVDTAKGVGMILVVFGHALSDTMLTNPDNVISRVLFDFIYSFHMPLFFFLSGFCGAKVLEMFTWKQKTQYISVRFKRLMVPYFFVGLLYVPLKLMLSGEVNTQLNLKALPLDFLSGMNPNFQLWTLYALFVSAALTCILTKQGNTKVLFGVSLAMCCVSLFVSLNVYIVQKVFFEFFFFVCGILYRKRYKGQMLKVSIVGLLILMFIGANIGSIVLENNAFKLVTGITGIALVCEICKRIEKVNTYILDVVGSYSMDIYIMANLVQVFVRTIFLYKLRIPAIICCVISAVGGGSIANICIEIYCATNSNCKGIDFGRI